MASGRHLLGIINDVLDLAKTADGKLKVAEEDVDLGAIVEDCGRIVSDQCVAAGFSIRILPPSEPLNVWGDEAKLRQVLLNLLSNAIKFSPSGGTVTLAARSVTDDVAELLVADTGIGIDAAALELLGQPFMQADASIGTPIRWGQSGLGLAISRSA